MWYCEEKYKIDRIHNNEVVMLQTMDDSESIMMYLRDIDVFLSENN